MNPTKKRQLLKILPYPIIFLLNGLSYVNIEYAVLGNTGTYPVLGTEYHPFNSLVSVCLSSTLLGMVLGVIEEVFFKKRFKQQSFTVRILLKTGIYVSLFLATLAGSSIGINAVNLGKSFWDPASYEPVITFFLGYGLFGALGYIGSVVALALFFSEIVDYLGLDVVSNFFSGKYSKPVYEHRIFMFLDMKGSTTIAEQIGHKRHYELINDYYGDMTNAIVETQGAIYQYVGDEIVVSWKLEKGLNHCNFLRCFFLIEESIAQRSDYYQNQYGVVPTFKAGFHTGEVTRGQVGQIKRDLLYTGDVLNATARIQGLCNQLDTNLLISAPLKAQLPENDFRFTSKGEFELRGRQKQEELFSVQQVG